MSGSYPSWEVKVKVCLGWVGSSDSISLFLCDCGLIVEGCVSHGFDPTGDGGFLTWHNTWLREGQMWCEAAAV